MARSLLIVIYSMIRKGTVYTDLVTNYLDERHRKPVVRQAVRRIETLRCYVILELPSRDFPRRRTPSSILSKSRN